MPLPTMTSFIFHAMSRGWVIESRPASSQARQSSKRMAAAAAAMAPVRAGRSGDQVHHAKRGAMAGSRSCMAPPWQAGSESGGRAGDIRGPARRCGLKAATAPMTMTADCNARLCGVRRQCRQRGAEIALRRQGCHPARWPPGVAAAIPAASNALANRTDARHAHVDDQRATGGCQRRASPAPRHRHNAPSPATHRATNHGG